MFIKDPRVLKSWLYRRPAGIRVLKQDTPTVGVTPVASLRPLCFGNDGVQDMYSGESLIFRDLQAE